MKKCSECQYSKWSEFFEAHLCKHEKGLGIIFRGKTKPHKCPLGKCNYRIHGNVNRSVRGMKSYHKARGYYT